MAKLVRDLTVDVHGGAMVVPPKTGAKLPSRTDRQLLISTGRGVVRIDLKDGSAAPVVGDLNMPAGLAVGPDGKTLFVADLDPAEQHFVLYQHSLTAKSKARGKALLRAAGVPGQLAASRSTLFYADRVGGKLVAVDLRSGDSQILTEGLASPVGVFLPADGKKIYVSERDAGRIVSVPPEGGSPTVELNGILAPRYLTAGSKAGTILVTQETGAGGVLSWRLASGEVEPLLDLDAGEQPVAAWPISRRLIVASATRLRWWDLVAVATLPVQLKVSTTTPFIGTYLRVAVDMGTTGIGFDDLEFSIPDGDAGGLLSYARDDESAPNEVMLLVGWQPGPHRLIATDRSTGSTVAELEYEISDRWADSNKSPSRWNVGEMSYFTTGYTWGGGPVGPQNINVLPPGSLRNVCILMVELSDAMYPTGSTFDTARNAWADGAVGSAPSAKTYYEEVSHGSFSLSLVESPPPRVTLSSAWTDNFEGMPAPWPANSFTPIDGQAFAQACVSAAAALTDSSGNALVDFSTVQSLILVIRSQGTAATDKFFWAQAWGGSFTIPGGTTVPMAVLGMPDDWAATRGGGRTIDETLSHELGHNLGFPDLYTNADPNFSADVMSRDITNYDLMSFEGRTAAPVDRPEDGVRLGGGDGGARLRLLAIDDPARRDRHAGASRGRPAAHQQVQGGRDPHRRRQQLLLRVPADAERRRRRPATLDQHRHGRPGRPRDLHAHARVHVPDRAAPDHPARARRRGREVVLHVRPGLQGDRQHERHGGRRLQDECGVDRSGRSAGSHPVRDQRTARPVHPALARRRQLAEPRHRSAQRALGHGSGALVQHSVDRACEHGCRSLPQPRAGDVPQREGRHLREGLHGRWRSRSVPRQRHARRAARVGHAVRRVRGELDPAQRRAPLHHRPDAACSSTRA